MPRTDFEEIWNLILAYKGEIFYTKRGYPFTYKMVGNAIRPIRNGRKINQLIPEGDFQKVYPQLPIPGPGVINRFVRGPAFVWGILHDQRISRGEW